MKGFLTMPYRYLRRSFLSGITNLESIYFNNVQCPMIFGKCLVLESVLYKKRSEKFCKTRRKIPALESLFIKLQSVEWHFSRKRVQCSLPIHFL